MNILFSIFIFSLSINYFTGPSLTESPYPKKALETDPYYPKFEMQFGKVYSLGIKWILRRYTTFADIKGWENFLILSFSKNFSIKKFVTQIALGGGSFTYEGPSYYSYYSSEESGSYTQYILAPSIQIIKRIPSTNILVGFSLQGFYTVIRKKHSYPLKGVALFFDFGAVLKE